MITINNTRQLFIYLHERLLEGKPEVPAPAVFDLVPTALIDGILDDGRATGFELDQWEYVFSDLIEPDEADRKPMISKPMASFLAEYLADLAVRGSGGSITVEQVLMMQICALSWSNRFTFDQDGELPTLELLPKYQKQMGLGVRLVLDEVASPTSTTAFKACSAASADLPKQVGARSLIVASKTCRHSI